VVHDIDPEPVADVVSAIHASGGKAVGVVADISSWDGAAEVIATCVDEFGRIDGLVNNAGRFSMSRLDEMEPDDVSTLVASNVLGTAFCATHAARFMVRHGTGSIVNVTSGAHAGIPLMGVYGATKGAVASFTYAWAAELVGTGVRCNAISPLGRTRMVDTTRRYLETKGLPMYPGETPEPDANAPVAVFLLSDLSTELNGQIVRIEGEQLSVMTHPAVWLPVLTRDIWTFEAVAEAFATDLIHRRSPTGVVGIRPDVTDAASAFWQ
jgi:NAD(P)-dependent dehydrogenase (short-subunit alcohol dehydrogenase family)